MSGKGKKPASSEQTLTDILFKRYRDVIENNPDNEEIWYQTLDEIYKEAEQKIENEDERNAFLLTLNTYRLMMEFENDLNKYEVAGDTPQNINAMPFKKLPEFRALLTSYGLTGERFNNLLQNIKEKMEGMALVVSRRIEEKKEKEEKEEKGKEKEREAEIREGHLEIARRRAVIYDDDEDGEKEIKEEDFDAYFQQRAREMSEDARKKFRYKSRSKSRSIKSASKSASRSRSRSLALSKGSKKVTDKQLTKSFHEKVIEKFKSPEDKLMDLMEVLIIRYSKERTGNPEKDKKLRTLLAAEINKFTSDPNNALGNEETGWDDDDEEEEEEDWDVEAIKAGLKHYLDEIDASYASKTGGARRRKKTRRSKSKSRRRGKGKRRKSKSKSKSKGKRRKSKSKSKKRKPRRRTKSKSKKQMPLFQPFLF